VVSGQQNVFQVSRTGVLVQLYSHKKTQNASAFSCSFRTLLTRLCLSWSS